MVPRALLADSCLAGFGRIFCISQRASLFSHFCFRFSSDNLLMDFLYPPTSDQSNFSDLPHLQELIVVLSSITVSCE